MPAPSAQAGQATRPPPQGQPRNKVVRGGTMSDGMRRDAQEQYTTLLEARPTPPTPHVLDD